jgi:hypothetical protein
MCVGWELLADEGKFVAHKMWREGVRVVLEEYEAMPHCFGLVFPGLGGSKRCLEGWAGFVKGVGEGGGGGKEVVVESRAVIIQAKSLREVVREFGEVWGEGEEVVAERVWRGIRERGVPEEGVAKL